MQLEPSEHESLDRLVGPWRILQLKRGWLDRRPLLEKFGVDILQRFAAPLAALESEDMLRVGDERVELTRKGLLRVDHLLPNFYAAEYRGARYT